MGVDAAVHVEDTCNITEFTKQEYEEICEEAMLNDELRLIFKMKIEGCSITKIADVTHLSERTVNRRIKELKKKVIKVL